jgi:hypothetical protein
MNEFLYFSQVDDVEFVATKKQARIKPGFKNAPALRGQVHDFVVHAKTWYRSLVLLPAQFRFVLDRSHRLCLNAHQHCPVLMVFSFCKQADTVFKIIKVDGF